jgi:amino acid transporter
VVAVQHRGDTQPALDRHGCGAGPSSLTMWVLAALLFFIPQGLAVSYLSARFPNEGGIYFWAKRSFGESHGFLCGWTYWVNNILYYPNLLMSTAAMAPT